MEKQHLPTYTHKFLEDKRWLTRETDHYIFRYFQNSEAEKDVAMIVTTQEKAFKKIIAFLDIKPPEKKIEYYYYPDKEVKETLMGDDWYAQSIYDEFRIHVVYTRDIKPLGEHEDTHLLSLPWGISIGFFQEGLAEFMVGHAWDGKSHISYVQEGFSKHLYLPLSDFFEHEAWLRTDDSKPLHFYSLVGSFTTYLINNYGRDKFKDLYMNTRRDYTRTENQAVFEKIYGPIGSVEKGFRVYIR